MEEEGWKRDEKPYLVFKCSKCHQYSYVKLTQKTKKCLRCDRIHQVNRIKQSGVTVKGMTKAIECVQTRQNELKGNINLQAEGGFVVAISRKKNGAKRNINSKINSESELMDTCLDNFRNVLKSLSDLYDEFPRFMIDMMAEEYNIPQKEINFLINKLKRENFLTEIKNSYFKVKK